MSVAEAHAWLFSHASYSLGEPPLTSAPPKLLDRIKSLSPRDFEHAVFDLLSVAGLRNLIWRTPGADQGRDIEGQEHSIDISGAVQWHKWYVECKRYDSTIDWPTVRRKIAYAENHDANYLLLVTTAHLSPQCKTEVSAWNAKRESPKVRFWDAGTIEARFRRHPEVLFLHGLSETVSPSDSPFLELSRALSSTVQSAYGFDTIRDNGNAALETAAALAELLTHRLSLVDPNDRPVASRFAVGSDGYAWLDLGAADLRQVNKYGLRAIACVLKHVLGRERLANASPDPDAISFSLDPDEVLGIPEQQLLALVAVWGGCDLTTHGGAVTLRSRTT